MEKIALLFPGQGCHYIGMGKSLYDDFKEAREVFEEANEVLNFDLKKICFEGRLSELSQITNMLLSIYTVSVAAFKVYEKEIGIVPVIAAGHSLGEYSALTCSGVMSFSDGLKILHKRSLLAEKQMDFGYMTVVNNMNSDVIEQICKDNSKEEEVVAIACLNSEKQSVIAGHNMSLMNVENKLMDLGAQITPMLMSPPFHSKIMNSSAFELEKEIKKYKFKKSRWPIISNVSAESYTDSEKLIYNLINQMKKQVKWKDTMNLIKGKGISTIVEIGPQMILGNMINKSDNIKAFSFGQKNDRDDLKGYLESKQRLNVKKIIIACMRAVVCTPNYNFNNDEYKEGVILPYERLQKILKSEEFEKESTVTEVIDLLKKIFITKKLPVNVQKERFRQVFFDSNFEAEDFGIIL